MSHQSAKVFGIDLGTTYSCISYIDEAGKPVIIPNSEHRLTTPSVVLFEGKNRIVGEEARNSALLQPESVVEMVKRHMGEAEWRFAYQEREYTPEEISSYILRKLAADAQAALGVEVSDVVITCPAYFGLAQREATARAGEIAGLTVREIINEPTAAALSYGLQSEQDQVVLVYDLGGGTFDVTIIEIKQGAITVIATGGDHHLGGRNWDEALVIYLAQQWQAETGQMIDPTDDAETLQELWLKAEKAKCTLTSRKGFKLPVTHAGQVAKVTVTRDKFDELTSGLLDRTILFMQVTMDEARARGYDHIDLILLVGGSTRMPQVSARLEAEFQLPMRLFDPDEAVAKGAALYGHKLLLDQPVQHKKSKATTGQKAKETQPQPVESHARSEQVQAEEAAPQPAAPRSRPAKTRAESLVEQPTVPMPTSAFSPGGEEDKERESLVLPTDLRPSDQAASRMAERLHKTTITNVTSHSFGIIVTIAQHTPQCREVIENLVVVNDPLPSLRVHTYGTLEANQELVEIRIIENTEKASMVEMDRYSPEAEIGKVVLPLPPGLPQHAPIDVTFELNQQGRLHVVGYEPRSKAQVEATFESGMSAQEVSEARSHSLQLTIL